MFTLSAFALAQCKCTFTCITVPWIRERWACAHVRVGSRQTQVGTPSILNSTWICTCKYTTEINDVSRLHEIATSEMKKNGNVTLEDLFFLGISGKPHENKDIVTFKAHSHRAKVDAKAKMFFYVCRFSFDLSRFRLV